MFFFYVSTPLYLLSSWAQVSGLSSWVTSPLAHRSWDERPVSLWDRQTNAWPHGSTTNFTPNFFPPFQPTVHPSIHRNGLSLPPCIDLSVVWVTCHGAFSGRERCIYHAFEEEEEREGELVKCLTGKWAHTFCNTVAQFSVVKFCKLGLIRIKQLAQLENGEGLYLGLLQ